MSDQIDQFIPESLQPQPPANPKPPEKSSSKIYEGMAVIVAGLAVALLGLFWLTRDRNHSYKGQGWSYHFKDVQITAPLSGEMIVYLDQEFYEEISEMGQQGWELVGVMESPRRPVQKGISYRLVFKRPGSIVAPEVRESLARQQEPRRREKFEEAVRAETEAQTKGLQRMLESANAAR